MHARFFPMTYEENVSYLTFAPWSGGQYFQVLHPGEDSTFSLVTVNVF